MSNKGAPMAQSKDDAILAKLDVLTIAQHHTAALVAEVNIHIKGNGGKGLHQRTNEVEAWIKTHPVACPVDTKAMERRQKWALAIFGAIMAVITLLINVLPPLFVKGG